MALPVVAFGAVAVATLLPAGESAPHVGAGVQPLGQVAAQAGAVVTAAEVTDIRATPAAPPPPKAPSPAAQPGYLNPLRAVSGLILERVDMGVDFGGAGPVFAIGDAVVINAEADNAGWPGGGWITYQLTDGPAAGLVVYVAEDVTPTVVAGEQVTPDTVIANMFNGGDGIETGWAMPDGESAESQLAIAGGIGGDGPFPTMVGLNFDALLVALGVPAAPNADDPPSGLLPANYPTSWSGLSS